MGGAVAGQLLIAELLQENKFDPEFVNTMLEVFKSVCRTLQVSDATDPLSNSIARTVILIAVEGERDPDELYKRTLNIFYSNK